MPSFRSLLLGALTVATALGTNQRPVDALTLQNRNALTKPVPRIPSSAFSQYGSSNGTWPWQIYKTEPFNPPVLNITSNGEPLSDGFVFIAPGNFNPLANVSAVKQNALLVFNDNGQLVWNGPSAPVLSTTGYHDFKDLQVVDLNGTDYLMYYYGGYTPGSSVFLGYGNVTFLDTNYNPVYTVCPDLDLQILGGYPFECQIDIHEHQVTPWGTMLHSAYNITRANLTKFGGPEDGYLYDCLVFEVDIKTSDVLWKWSALDHVPLEHSHLPPNSGNATTPWDYFHINAIDVVGGDILINARHTWEVYLVEKCSGNIKWTINGDTGGDFGALPEGANFRWQHDARAHNVSNSSISISLFNNNNHRLDRHGPSNALELHLPLPPGSTPATLIQSLKAPSEQLNSLSQGSYKYIPNDQGYTSQLVNYGQVPIVREFGPTTNGSDLRWEARFGADDVVQNYRAYKQVWHATPQTSPKLVVEDGVAYVSWNGATDVIMWEVYQGASEDKLERMGEAPYMGFETRFEVTGPCVQVGAKDFDKKSNCVCS